MPRGRAQVSMVCSNLPAGSRIERVLLFSLEMKTLPVPFASRDLVGASAIVHCEAGNGKDDQPPAAACQSPPELAAGSSGSRARAAGPITHWHAAYIVGVLLLWT